MSARALSHAELLEAAAVIEGRLLAGDTADEIMDTLGYNVDQYNEARRFLLEAKSTEIRNRSREHTYVEYVLEQRRSIKDLDKLVKDLDKQSQYNAVVGAIRLRSDLIDRIIDRGQDFGFIKKEAASRDLIAGIIITDMSNADLKKEIVQQNKLLVGLMEKFGEKSFLELEDKPLHYGSPVFKKTISTTAEDVEEDDEALLPPPKALATTKKKKKTR